jgi:hypothetical protein
MLSSTACDSLWMSDTVSKRRPFSFSPASRGMGNDNHVVVSHKLCGFQGCVGGRVVVMKEPVVVAPKFRSFSSHIFSQESQNVTLKVKADCSVRRNKFKVKNPLHIKKMMIMLLTCCAFFALGDCTLFLTVIVQIFGSQKVRKFLDCYSCNCLGER